MASNLKNSAVIQLALGTGAFALCVAVFGLLSAMVPMLSRQMHLSPMHKSLAVAAPVLLGSLGRIPLGMLADRFGGRIVFSLVMLATILSAFLMGTAHGGAQMVGYGVLTGIGLASFSVGVGFVSGWYPKARQGWALGIYGAGDIGQSLASFGAPLIAAAAGIEWGYWTFGLLLAIWFLIFIMLARDAPLYAPALSFSDTLKPLSDMRIAVLSLYYFLTFGGFVVLSLYLPILLTDTFRLTPQQAGLRTAGFIVLATVTRPIGGSLADRVGGRAILQWIFPAIAFFSIFLASSDIAVFRFGALATAILIGLGNGAVFKLVPEYFPEPVGSVTGIVGAAGGLGGFFPPLALGFIREETGHFTLGFVLLAVFSLICLAVLLHSKPSRIKAPALE